MRPDRIAIPPVGRRVVRILRTAHNRHVVQRLVPRVVGLQEQALREPPDHFRLHLVRNRIAVRIERENIRPRLKRPVRLHRAQCLPDRQVAVVVVPRHARALVANIRYAQAHVGRNLPFHREVELRRRRVPDLPVHRGNARIGRQRARARERIRQR